MVHAKRVGALSIKIWCHLPLTYIAGMFSDSWNWKNRWRERIPNRKKTCSELAGTHFTIGKINFNENSGVQKVWNWINRRIPRNSKRISQPSQEWLVFVIGLAVQAFVGVYCEGKHQGGQDFGILQPGWLVGQADSPGQFIGGPRFYCSPALGAPWNLGSASTMAHFIISRHSWHLEAPTATVRAIGYANFCVPPFWLPPGIWAALVRRPVSSYPGSWGVCLRPVLAGAGCLVFAVAAKAHPRLPPATPAVPVAMAYWELAPFAGLWFLTCVAVFDVLGDLPTLSPLFDWAILHQ